MLAVVLLHGAIAYVHTPAPSLVWPVWDVRGRDDTVNNTWIRYVVVNEKMPKDWPDAPQERARIAAFDAASRPADYIPDVIVLWGRTGAVPLFFALAGMLGAQSRARSSTREFVRARLRRLGVPFLLGVFLLLPVTYAVWSWGLIARAWITPSNAVNFVLPTFVKQSLLGPAHLWFVEYLLICSVLFALVPRISSGIPPREHDRRGLALRDGRLPPLLIPFFVLGIIACFYLDPLMLTDFRNSFMPRPALLGASMLFFALGASLDPGVLANPERGSPWPASLVLAHGAFAWWLWIMWRDNDAHSLRAACAAGAFASLSVLGWISLFLRLGGAGRASWLASHSFAIYVLHLPLVASAQIVLYRAPVPPLLKIAGVTGVGFGLSLFLSVVWRHIRPRAFGARASEEADGSAA